MDAFDQEFETLRKEYLDELLQTSDELEEMILRAEKEEDSASFYKKLVRRVHSVKGAAGSYGFPLIATICHLFEDYIRVKMELNLVNSDVVNDFLEFHSKLVQTIKAYKKGSDVDIEKIHEKVSKGIVAASAKKKEIRVLVVEATATVSRIIKKAFDDRPARIAYAKDGYEALGRLLQEDFDLVLSSFHLPILDGMTVLHAVKLSQGKNKNAKFILVSSSNAQVEKYKGLFQPDLVVAKDVNTQKHISQFIDEKM